MARMPSMTAQEAEAALGPRGDLRVTSDNRAIVRKWLVSQGFPSLFAGGLSLTELGLAYNQTDGAMLSKLREKLSAVQEDQDETEQDEPIPSCTDRQMARALHEKTNGHDTDPAATQLAQAIQALMSRPTGVDADKVREIIRAELPALIPTSKLELTIGNITRELPAATRHAEFETVLSAVACNIPVALVGPAGSGKTTLGEQLSEALGTTFYMNGAVSGAHEYLGFVDGHGTYHTTPFRQAFEHGGLYLGDELDGSDPAAPMVLNAALANGSMPFPDSPLPVKRHPDFRMIAAANTYWTGADRVYVGRNQLDGATLDRFVFVDFGYDKNIEAALCPDARWLARVQALRAAAAKEKARIIISPRASLHGAKLLAAGMAWHKVEALCIWKGTDAELRRRIEQAV